MCACVYHTFYFFILIIMFYEQCILTLFLKHVITAIKELFLPAIQFSH